jgi:hypothetical protein
LGFFDKVGDGHTLEGSGNLAASHPFSNQRLITFRLFIYSIPTAALKLFSIIIIFWLFPMNNLKKNIENQVKSVKNKNKNKWVNTIGEGY